MRDLTTSAVDRQNILNNLDAVSNIQEYLGVKGMLFDGEFRKRQVAVEGIDDPISIRPHLSFVVQMQAMRVTVPGNV